MSDLTWTPIKIRIGQIRPWTDNPRMSTKAQAERLIQSEQELGQIQTLAVSPFDGDFVDLYDGHQRYSAWMTVKPRDFEVVALQSNRPLREDERRKVAILLHTATGGWNWQTISGWTVGELKQWGLISKENIKGWQTNITNVKEIIAAETADSIDAEAQMERADELQQKWNVKEGDLWKCGNHLLLCGDSAKREYVSKVMCSDKATLLFTDPPYGVSIGDKNKFLNKFQKSGRVLTSIESDDATAEVLGDMLLQVFTLSKEFLAEDCSIFVCSPQGGSLGIMMMMMMRDAGMEVRHVLNWVKNSPTFSFGRLDYEYKHEPILFTWIKKHKKIMNGQFKNSVWTVDKPMANKEHPTMKPVELYENALLNHTDNGDILYEPFGGSGTGMIAAENTKRVCRMIELTPRYCSVILERFHTAFPDEEIKLL